jgi:hypothetical protein
MLEVVFDQRGGDGGGRLFQDGSSRLV